MQRTIVAISIMMMAMTPLLWQPVVQAANPLAETLPASNVEEYTMTLHGYIESAGGDPEITTRFYYDCTPGGLKNTSNQTCVQYDYVSQEVTGLYPGTFYRYYVYANNTQGNVSGNSRYALTKPEWPTNASVTAYPSAGVVFEISWDHGSGSNKTIVVYNATAPPTNRSEGTIIYEGNGTTATVLDGEENVGDTHYFALWDYAAYTYGDIAYEQYSNRTLVQEDLQITIVDPRIQSSQVYGLTNSTATLEATFYDGNETCTTNFKYACLSPPTVLETAYIYRTSGTFNETITGLLPGTRYLWYAQVNNTAGSSWGNVTSFITRPDPPTTFSIDAYNETSINLSWTKGLGAKTTYIVRKTGAYPANVTDGIAVYDGNGTTFTDVNFTSHASQYYRAWSKSSEVNITQYSETYLSQATLNADFNILFPQYLNVGQYIMAWGMIIEANGNPVLGMIANTTVRTLDDTIVLGPVHWNCSSGNYQTAIATTNIQPGIYEIMVTFTNGTGITFTHRNKLFIATNPTDPGIYVNAWVYYTFYDISTGTGLDDNYYKVYISADTTFQSGDRIKGGKIGVIRSTGEAITTNTEYYIQIRDFNDNIVPFGECDTSLVTLFTQGAVANAYAAFNVKAAEFYIDFGVYLNQLRIKNMNASTVYVILRRTDGNPGQILGRFIPPWEETEVFIPDGTYNVSIHYYNNNHPEYGPTRITYPWDVFGVGYGREITTDLFYWVQGYQLDDVINLIEEEGTWVYYTIFDMNTGSKLEDDFYKVYISEDTTFTSADRAWNGHYKTTPGNTLYLQVLDYWNNRVYPVATAYDTVSIVDMKTFLDIGIPLNQFLIKNVNSSLIYLRLTNGNFSDPVNNTWYNRWIPPHESKELFLRQGTYNMSIEYYYPHNGQLIKYENISNLTISQDVFYVVRGNNALVYFNFYNTNTGLGLPYDALKIYVNTIRLPYNHIRTEMGSNETLTILDYYDNELYNHTYTIRDPLTYIDLGLTFHSYKFTNDHEDFFIIGLKKENATRWWEKAVGPYETIEFLPPTANYTIRIYNTTMYYATFNETVNSTKMYVITGHNFTIQVDEIIEGQNRVIAKLENQTEAFNDTNLLLFQTLDITHYSNSTITSMLNIFRLPHMWQIPTIKYTFSDVSPPISTIYAQTAITGGILVRWHTTDATSDVQNVTLYYRVDNATSWKPWHTNCTASGQYIFNESTESLVEQKTYWFKAIGQDTKGNMEGEHASNICNITYKSIVVEQQTTASELVKDAMGSWVFWCILIAIVGLVVVVVVLERKQEKITEKHMRMPYRRYPPQRQPSPAPAEEQGNVVEGWE